MSKIANVAVIGSGVMGSGIAALIASSNTPVLLLDIVPEGEADRSKLAKGALEKIKSADPAMLTHKKYAKNITPGNLEDDLDRLKECDWIIEVVLEKLEVKQNLYKKLEDIRKDGSIISSNTSTLPLHNLVDGMPKRFRNDFCITHFFNPPRYMRLLELVSGKDTKQEHLETLRRFCEVTLGKGVVACKDTPGFIANRIGIYWLTVAINRAIDMNVPVEVADAVLSKPVGIPKTGVFGLMDLIGIDLLPLIAKSYGGTLDKSDRFFEEYTEHKVVTDMIQSGFTGRKGKGGFYRINKEGGKKIKEVKNLRTGEYAPEDKPNLASIDAAKGGLQTLVTHKDLGGQYAWAVLSETLSYAASLVPEISDDIASVDAAMRDGYNWKYGPFELIDRLEGDGVSGPKWLAERLRAEKREVPALLDVASDTTFYQDGRDANGHPALMYLSTTGGYEPIPFDPESWLLADIKRGSEPVAKNPSAALWDVGDGVLCLEFTSKMNAIDPMIFDMIDKAVELCGGAHPGEAKRHPGSPGGDPGSDVVRPGSETTYRGLIIGNDAENFSVGANLGLALYAANVSAWKMLSEFVQRGQDTYMKLKYAPFPVVGAPSGMALGGGCEILLHCDAVNAHIELYSGLVEVGVGVIPGWGGCKEMLYRHLKQRAQSDAVAAKFGKWFSFLSPVKTLNAMPPLSRVFETISLAKVAKSAEEAKDMLILNEKSQVTMNRRRVLPDAKKLCLQLAENYRPPETYPIRLPGKTARVALDMAIKNAAKQGKALPHDVVVSTALGYVLSGGETDITKDVAEQQLLDLERKQFDHLLKTKETLARIEHMLETGKPLRN